MNFSISNVLIFLITVFIVSCSTSQDCPSSLKGPVKSISENSIRIKEVDGYFIQEYEVNYPDTKSTYDENYNQITRSIYDSKSTIVARCNYTYKKNRLVSVEWDNSLMGREIIVKLENIDSKTKKETTFTDGVITSEAVNSKISCLERKSNFKNYRSGELSFEVNIKTIYNEENVLIEMVQDDGEAQNHTRYKYFNFDEYGNWTHCFQISDDGYHALKVRHIEYSYENADKKSHIEDKIDIESLAGNWVNNKYQYELFFQSNNLVFGKDKKRRWKNDNGISNIPSWLIRLNLSMSKCTWQYDELSNKLLFNLPNDSKLYLNVSIENGLLKLWPENQESISFVKTN